jgi:serine/threonine protein kinase
MPYLEAVDFKNKYLDYTQAAQTGRGGYGSVFSTQTHIIKTQERLFNFVKELNICSAYDHPCLVQVEDWTIDKINDKYVYAFSQPRGIPITEALQKNLITLKQVITDIYSAIKFLHSVGVIHLDVKPQNMIYLNKRAVLIDFGLAVFGYSYENGLFSYKNVGYTISFRDPEFNFDTFNHCDSDFYAYAISIAYLYLLNTGRQPPALITEVDFIEDDDIRFICEECTKPKNIRSKNLQAVIESSPLFLTVRKTATNIPIKNIIPGQIKTTPPLPVDENCGQSYYELCIGLNDVMSRDYFKTPARTGFLTHHLLQRCFGNIVDYETYTDIAYINLGLVCFYLSNSIYSHTIYDITDFLDVTTSNTITKDTFLDMIIEVLNTCQNIIATPTFWDYAHSAEDLPSFLSATVSCFYNNESIPKFTNGRSDKNVLFSSIVGETNKKLNNDKDEEVEKNYVTTLQTIPIFRDEPKPNAAEQLNSAISFLQGLFQKNQEAITFNMIQAVYLVIAYREYVPGLSLQSKYVLQMTFNKFPPKLTQKYFPNGF